MTVAEMVKRMARTIGDTNPATGEPIYDAYTRDAYVSWLNGGNSMLAAELPPEDLPGLVRSWEVSYSSTVNFASLNPVPVRICVDSVTSDWEPCSWVGKDVARRIRYGSVLYDPTKTYAWFLIGDKKMNVFPVRSELPHPVARFDGIIAPKPLVYENPTAEQTDESELPVAWHEAILWRAFVYLFDAQAWPTEKQQYLQMFVGKLEGAKQLPHPQYPKGAIAIE